MLVLVQVYQRIIAYLQQSPNLDPLHVYPVLPPHVASGEIFNVGVEEALLDVRVVRVVSVFNRVEDELEGCVELDCEATLLESLRTDESEMDEETEMLEALVLVDGKMLL
jgi:hypothetical protein